MARKRKISTQILISNIDSARHNTFFLLLLLLGGDVERNPRPTVITTDTITDSKSVFQGHCAPINSENQVAEFLNLLKSNKKIAAANHNIYAYILSKNGKIASNCCSGAGRKLYELLRRSQTENVLVVVTRWYGGIHLGPTRLLHIINRAKIALKVGGHLGNAKALVQAKASKAKASMVEWKADSTDSKPDPCKEIPRSRANKIWVRSKIKRLHGEFKH